MPLPHCPTSYSTLYRASSYARGREWQLSQWEFLFSILFTAAPNGSLDRSPPTKLSFHSAAAANRFPNTRRHNQVIALSARLLLLQKTFKLQKKKKIQDRDPRPTSRWRRSALLAKHGSALPFQCPVKLTTRSPFHDRTPRPGSQLHGKCETTRQ